MKGPKGNVLSSNGGLVLMLDWIKRAPMTKRQAKRIVATFAKRSALYTAAERCLAQ